MERMRERGKILEEKPSADLLLCDPNTPDFLEEFLVEVMQVLGESRERRWKSNYENTRPPCQTHSSNLHKNTYR